MHRFWDSIISFLINFFVAIMFLPTFVSATKRLIMSDFIPNRGHYRSLVVYQVAESIYDIAFYFAHTFLERGDRTIDQMIQAASSCKQNIMEGSAASTTSLETEIKLLNVARAS